MVFAAFLKLLMPVIVVIPGIAAVILAPDLAKPDEAYPTMMRYLPTGILGLVFSALVAAIVASTASKINSIATIFTLDLYAKFGGAKGVTPAIEEDTGHPHAAPRSIAEERKLVLVGRLSAVAAVIIAVLTARPLLGGSDQAFQFIQEFTGFFTPGIVVIFLLGLFWKRASEAGAVAAAVASVVLSWAGKALLPDFPFMDRMGLIFLASLALAVAVSLVMPNRRENFIVTSDVSYRTSTGFNVASVGVILILIVLYATWW